MVCVSVSDGLVVKGFVIERFLVFRCRLPDPVSARGDGVGYQYPGPRVGAAERADSEGRGDESHTFCVRHEWRRRLLHAQTAFFM